MRNLLERSVITTWASFIAKALLPIAVLPFVLKAYDDSAVAVWLLFATFGSLTAVMDFGLMQTTARLISYRAPVDVKGKSHDGQSWNEVARVVQAAHKLYSRCGVVAAIGIAIVGSGAIARPLLAAGNGWALWGAWSTVPLALGVLLASNHYAALLFGTNRISTLRLVEVGTASAALLASILVIQADLPLGALLLVGPAGQILTAVGLRRACAHVYPSEVFSAAHGCQQEQVAIPLSRIWRPAWRSGLGVLASLGMFHAAAIAYGILLPAAEAASYLFACRIILAISVVSQAPFYTRLPVYASQWAAGDREAIIADAKSRMRLSYLVFVSGVVAAAYAIPPILQGLDSNTKFVSPTLWALLSAAIFVERWGAMHLQLYSIGNEIVWHIANGITGVLVIAFTLIAIGPLGALSFPAACLFAFLVFYGPFCAKLSYRQFRVANAVRFESSVTIPFAAVLLVALGIKLAV